MIIENANKKQKLIDRVINGFMVCIKCVHNQKEQKHETHREL